MDGTDILARSMSAVRPRGKDGWEWQYNSQSDSHSKVACWGIVFDLLRYSDRLRQQVADREVVFGVNFEITNFVSHQSKNLDLVIARPEGPPGPRARTFREWGDKWNVLLSDEQEERLGALPEFTMGEFGANAVRMALEAKACMTAHSKAGPRLYDELNSSHQIIHSASQSALAVGFAMVNASETFISSVSNPRQHFHEAERINHHKTDDALTTVDRVHKLPRRAGANGVGYDGLALVVIDMKNDGSDVRVLSDPPAPPSKSPLHYDAMIRRVANEYDARFG